MWNDFYDKYSNQRETTERLSGATLLVLKNKKRHHTYGQVKKYSHSITMKRCMKPHPEGRNSDFTPKGRACKLKRKNIVMEKRIEIHLSYIWSGEMTHLADQRTNVAM